MHNRCYYNRNQHCQRKKSESKSIRIYNNDVEPYKLRHYKHLSRYSNNINFIEPMPGQCISPPKKWISDITFHVNGRSKLFWYRTWTGWMWCVCVTPGEFTYFAYKFGYLDFHKISCIYRGPHIRHIDQYYSVHVKPADLENHSLPFSEATKWPNISRMYALIIILCRLQISVPKDILKIIFNMSWEEIIPKWHQFGGIFQLVGY